MNSSRGRNLWWYLGAGGLLWLLVATPGLAAEAASDGVIGQTVWETFQRGGRVMYVILATSILGLMFILESLVKSRRGAILPRALETRLEEEHSHAIAEEVLQQTNGKTCMRRILEAGFLWRHAENEQIQAAIEESVDETLWEHKRAIRPIGIIANTAPLLGLLGTVIGIVQAFDVVARSGALGDPQELAGGISKALLTTCFGLIVAIPMLLAYHYLLGRVETLVRKCEILAKECLILPPEEPPETNGAATPAEPTPEA